MQRVRCSLFVLIFFSSFLASGALAQSKATSATATCNFDEEKQLMVEYQQNAINPKRPLSSQVPSGKVWAPGGKPITLFTNTPVEIGSKMLPIGAYTLFVLPNSKQWTLIVSKSTDMSGAYNEQQDVVRVAMEFGELPSREPNLTVAFGHIAPDQCNIRIDLEKYGHFTTFHEK